MIRTRSLLLLLAALPGFAAAQEPLPPDIHPVTLSRLPPVTPEDLDEEGRRLLAERPNFRPGPDPRTSRSTIRRAGISAFRWATAASSVRGCSSSQR